MGFLIIIDLFALSLWTVAGTCWRLRRTHAGRSWWLAFAALALAGLAAGSWLALHFEYRVSPDMRFFSFPVPLAFFHLEDGRWVDFVTPPHVMYTGMVTNIVATVAASLLPLLLASAIIHPRPKGEKPVT